MTPERWHRIEELFEASARLAPGERTAFLDEACGSDEELRQEVESLLVHSDLAQSFIEDRALNIAAEMLVRKHPDLVGQTIGPYRVIAHAGAGGMGDVYRAEDTRLHRSVAIKVLAARTNDVDLKRRFEREARAIAALSHPHICTLYDVGQQDGIDYLVMEYLEGQTLADRLEKGPLPLDEALRHAAEILDALDAAHRHGVIHRDLKPANVMLTTNGVKLLDFGIAQLQQSLQSEHEPALSTKLTMEGTILGTPQYMAPEQLHGKTSDARADIFAFGAVLYEMVTGKKAFQGDTKAGLIASVLERNPVPAVELRPSIPRSLDRLIQVCLAKDPDARWQTARDLKRELAAADSTATSVVGPRPDSGTRGRIAILVILLGAVLATAAVYLRSPSPAARDVRFEIAVPEMPGPHDIVLSPDGRYVTYAAAAGKGKTALWLRAINSVEVRMLPGTEGGGEPFWSPDSKFIAFGQQIGAEHKLKKIDINGGPAQTITDLGSSPTCCGSWNRDGIIVFSHQNSLRRVSASGGEATNIAELDRSLEEQFHAKPQFLPDGRHFLYLAWSPRPENRAIYIGSLDSRTRTRLMTTESNAMYAPPGFILFLRERTLMARPFDADSLEFTGEAVPLAKNIVLNAVGALGAFAASDEGTLIFRSEAADTGSRRFIWMDRLGRQGTPIGAPTSATRLSLSPDAMQVAFAEAGPGGVWIHDFDRNLRTRLATGYGINPIWSADGSRLIFGLGPTTLVSSVYEKPSNGGGSERLLLQQEPGMIVFPLDASADGRFLILGKIMPGNIRDIWVLPLNRGTKPFPYLVTPFQKPQATLSPDGRWLAYVSGESGAYQVIVQPFPDPSGGKWQISPEGGICPQWRRHGGELFYLDAKGRIVAATVKTGRSFGVEKTAALFETRIGFPSVSVYPSPCPYDVTADGQRFLISEPLGMPSPITVVLNWDAALKP
jgi:serine/threonine protein kinase/Tol biopolymer transport system component